MVTAKPSKLFYFYFVLLLFVLQTEMKLQKIFFFSGTDYIPLDLLQLLADNNAINFSFGTAQHWIEGSHHLIHDSQGC